MTDDEWEATIEQTRAILRRRAQEGKGILTYKDLGSQLRQKLSLNFHYADLLEAVAQREQRAGLPALTALVVSKGEGLPGQGFWNVLAEDGYDITNRPASWGRALAHVYSYWHPRAEP